MKKQIKLKSKVHLKLNSTTTAILELISKLKVKLKL